MIHWAMCNNAAGHDVLAQFVPAPLSIIQLKTTEMDSQNQDPSGDTKGKTVTPIKKKPEDFIFGKVIGEGSYSTVSDYW